MSEDFEGRISFIPTQNKLTHITSPHIIFSNLKKHICLLTVKETNHKKHPGLLTKTTLLPTGPQGFGLGPRHWMPKVPSLRHCFEHFDPPRSPWWRGGGHIANRRWRTPSLGLSGFFLGVRAEFLWGERWEKGGKVWWFGGKLGFFVKFQGNYSSHQSFQLW